ncbi:YicC/YloC family endoribonuclease [Porphyromonas sp. HMSC065F10]|uniref:YicC/YloC family endoribonuclease n=1 Tax=Porphyromonas sp. HMSC065F10 TaxID=1739394 RepID=UPI001FEDF224|nr:YicC/YloC family endoribonuclease [Porphyromonas sp. HMSC065F10]
MIYSMTGYGRAEKSGEGKKVTVEIYSVNSKNADVNVHIPGHLRTLEQEIRKRTTTRCLRGKMDVYVSVDHLETQAPLTLDEQVAATYWERLQQLSHDTGIPLPQDPMRLIIGFQGVLHTVEIDEAERESDERLVMEALEEAVDHFIAFRAQEGESLYRVFQENIEAIRTLIGSTEPYEQERIDTVRERLETELRRVTQNNFDASRLEQEMIYYIDKLDVHEERNRLINHLSYFESTMDGEVGQGRKLGFIAQEIGREINTFGSKSNHATLQKITVKMKDHLEQIKEQVLNVL